MLQVRQWLKVIVKNSVVKVSFNYTSSSPACFVRFYLKTIQILYHKTVINGVWVKARTTCAGAFRELENWKNKYQFYVWSMTVMDTLNLKGSFNLNVLHYGEWLLRKRLAKRMGSPKDIYTECPRRNGQNFGRVFLMLNYTDITQNTYIQSWAVTEIMAREVWNFDSCYTLIDYQIHIETGRNMWFL